MNRWTAHLFNKSAETAGLPPDQASAAWAFIDALQDQKLPPVLTLRHLAHESGCSYGCLRLVATRRGIAGRYRSFRINKRSGGMRRIFVPTMELQSALRWIHDHILSVLQPHPRAFAYRAKTTVVDCASEHCGARWLVKFDAQDFFESIDEGQIFRVFRACGYPALLAFELARLTTVPVDFLTSRRDTIHIQSDIESACSAEGAVHVIQEYDFHERGVLGQGLVTSPALSNLVCRELDASLQKTANELGFVFTRYADDITFSTTRRQLTTLDVGTLRKRVLSVLRRNNLRENRKKFSVTGPGARRVVLGLLVDGEKPRLSRATRARIEGHLYFLTKLGANLHAARRKFRSIDALQQHLIGLLAYVKQVDGNLHATYEKLAKNIAWPPE